MENKESREKEAFTGKDVADILNPHQIDELVSMVNEPSDLDTVSESGYKKAFAPLPAHKSEVFKSVKQAVKEMNLITAGKMKGIPAEDLINEL